MRLEHPKTVTLLAKQMRQPHLLATTAHPASACAAFPEPWDLERTALVSNGGSKRCGNRTPGRPPTSRVVADSISSAKSGLPHFMTALIGIRWLT
jgi:hypothetical protein